VHGLAVLVGPEERDVQVVAGEGEVVGVAAEVGDLLLGREDEAHVRVLLVGIEVVHRALVQRDHVAALARLAAALLLDARDLGLARGVGGRVRHGRRHRAQHPRGHVLDAQELVHLVARTGRLLVAGGAQVARAHVVLLLGGEVLDAAEPHVVVADQEPVGRDEGAGPAVVEAHGGQAHGVEPGLGGREAVGRLEPRAGWVVEGEHALVGQPGSGQQGGQGQARERASDHASPPPGNRQVSLRETGPGTGMGPGRPGLSRGRTGERSRGQGSPGTAGAGGRSWCRGPSASPPTGPASPRCGGWRTAPGTGPPGSPWPGR